MFLAPVDRDRAAADHMKVRDGEDLDARSPGGTAAPPVVAAMPRRPRLERRAVARLVMWSLPAIVIAVSLFVWLSSGRYIITDNAYVKGDRAQIATELSGIIVEVPVKENQHVSRGQLLFKLDDQSYRLSLAKIEAEIETARADIRGLRAQWRTKREEIKAAMSQETFRAGRLRSPVGAGRQEIRLDPEARGSAAGPRCRAPAHLGGAGGPAAYRGRPGRRSQDPCRRSSAGQADGGGAR